MLLLSIVLRMLIQRGTLEVIGPDGRARTFGNGLPPHVTIRIADQATANKLALDSELVAGEAYMDGRLRVEKGDIGDFLDLALVNIGFNRHHIIQKFGRILRQTGKGFQQYNPLRRARRNVAHHYDLSGTLYDLFLDQDRQYSCAYFKSPMDTLEEAQINKKRHLARKLLLQPGQKVLDIGSGWGGLALTFAKEYGVDVTGVTLSEEQYKVATERARAAGLSSQVRFKLQDYRLEREQYDRIVSVGMFEHVGIGHYPEFFAKISTLLKQDGIALLHTIGRADGPGTTNAWIRKYIFPGGYSPALSEVIPSIENVGLYITDIEVWRLHYAQTIREWRQRFQNNRTEVLKLFDERFCRMWEFYLASSEAVFRHGGHVNFQIQMAKQVNAVPLTRDYIYALPQHDTVSMVAD